MSVAFEISKDQDHLSQYYSLREQCFRKELGIAGFEGGEEDRDRQGELLLMLREGECIGGARISSHISHPSQLEFLSIESSACCMWERFAVAPEVRSIQLLRQFCAHLIQTSRTLGYRHAMILSSLRNARFYRQCHSALGVDFEICRQVPHCAQGCFAGLEHYLSIANLSEDEALRVAV